MTSLPSRSARVLVTDGVDVQASGVNEDGEEVMLHRVSHASYVLIIEHSMKARRWEIRYVCFLRKRFNAESFAFELRNFNIIDGHHGHRRLEQLVRRLIET